MNAARIVILAKLDACLRQCGSARSSLQAMPELSQGISYPIDHVRKLASAAVALVATVGMNGEPVPVKMRKAAMGATHFNGFEAEDSRDHVVDGVYLVDCEPLPGEKIFGVRDPQASIGSVDVLIAVQYMASMNMNAAICRKRGGVVNSRN